MAEQEKPQNGYTGVNIRTDRSNVAEETHATRAVNVDFNKEIGTASIRNGRYELADLADNVVRLIAKVNSNRYYVAGQNLYRDGVAVSFFPEKLDSGLTTDIEAFRPLNDLAIWAFIADTGNREQIDSPVAEFTTNSTTGAITRGGTFTGRGHSAMKKDDGTRTFKWGIGQPPPTIKVLGGAVGQVEGDTNIWFITYIRYDTTNTANSQAVAHEGNPVTLSVTIESIPV